MVLYLLKHDIRKDLHNYQWLKSLEYAKKPIPISNREYVNLIL